ncbi:MAG: molybdate ABC transporter substrate-binding protein, partial [Bacteroidota bacterium]
MKFRFVLGIWALLYTACQQKTTAQLTIATAANMQFAMEALVHAFSEQYSMDCEVILSSSGKLTAQIQQGAPFDVFVSADMKYPNELYQNGFTLAPPKIYAYGQLVLWSLEKQVPLSVDLLHQTKFKHLAMANPRTAPYGRAAMEVLRYLKLEEQVEPQLVYGESIAQTNQFIVTQSADLGFTAKSVVLSPNIKGQGTWIE